MKRSTTQTHIVTGEISPSIHQKHIRSFFKNKKNVKANSNLDTNKADYDKCYFCGIEMEKFSSNNPEPLDIPEYDGTLRGCCSACNKLYVTPVRRVLWNDSVSKEECAELVQYARVIPNALLRDIISSENPLHLFREAKRYCNSIGIHLEPEDMPIWKWHGECEDFHERITTLKEARSTLASDRKLADILAQAAEKE